MQVQADATNDSHGAEELASHSSRNHGEIDGAMLCL